MIHQKQKQQKQRKKKQPYGRRSPEVPKSPVSQSSQSPGLPCCSVCFAHGSTFETSCCKIQPFGTHTSMPPKTCWFLAVETEKRDSSCWWWLFPAGFQGFFLFGGRKQKAVSLVFVAHPWFFLPKHNLGFRMSNLEQFFCISLLNHTFMRRSDSQLHQFWRPEVTKRRH